MVLTAVSFLCAEAVSQQVDIWGPAEFSPTMTQPHPEESDISPTPLSGGDEIAAAFELTSAQKLEVSLYLGTTKEFDPQWTVLGVYLRDGGTGHEWVPGDVIADTEATVNLSAARWAPARWYSAVITAGVLDREVLGLFVRSVAPGRWFTAPAK
jgi:hypothetical protein